ncbi:conjugal transfer protein TraP [Enterobacter hormaechei]|nr:conjugal transfer protein TraP [Enterobacter hormaechei]ELD3190778.1 conjugal transfer protein TraP [Enterobacter hormaechei]
MNEFQTLPENNAPVPPAAPPAPKKESLLTRPLFLGQSLPWLAGGALVIIAAALYLFWPASSTPDAGQLAFGNNAGFSEVKPAATPQHPATAPQTGGLNIPADAVSNTAVGSALPEDVVKIIRQGQDFEAANREAITRLSETVRAQTAALANLQQRLDSIESENSRLAGQLTILNARQDPLGSVRTPAGKNNHRSALSGMRLEGVQDGMAWVSWQGRTWAVQSGDRLGNVTVRDINAAERSVSTSAGVLR